MTFRLAHLSDPHVGPVLRPKLRELAGKRLTGYMNWRRGRHAVHDMGMLERITVDMLHHEPHHVALTGDLVNIGLESEFVTAQRFIQRIGPPEFVSVIPGNHDAYVRSSFAYMAATAAPWMTGDGQSIVQFPYLRVRGEVALIGVSSGVPTAPLLASGEIGKRQMAELTALLEDAGRRGLIRVVMIHHPPHIRGASLGRGLRDSKAFERVIASAGAELILHGHNHRFSVIDFRTPHGRAPVVGVASASAVPGSQNHRAAWHLYEIARGDGGLRIDMTVRGLMPSGAIGDIDKKRLL